jgi:hypothetical protein
VSIDFERREISSRLHKSIFSKTCNFWPPLKMLGYFRRQINL